VHRRPYFREVGLAAGLKYRWRIPGPRPHNILQTIGNGCAFLDYNGDGNLDILLAGPQLALYQGDGKGHFTDVSRATGLSQLQGHFLGCAVGDYDNDGFPDIYVSGYRTGLLLHNEHGARFRDVTREMVIKPQPWGTSCVWTDIDGDGYLDLVIGNYVNYSPTSDMQLCDENGVTISCGPRDYRARYAVIYHNERGKHFRDVTELWKLKSHGKTLGAAVADYDRSGHPALALANDLMDGDLFRVSRDGTLSNVGRESGTALDDLGSDHAGMGIDWGDYDNDGRFDLMVTTFSNEPKCLDHNEGYGLFKYYSNRTGVERPTLPYVGWGVKFFDADNDGWLDLIIANGHVNDNIRKLEPKSSYRQPVLFLHNRGGPHPFFQDDSMDAGIAALPRIVGRGLAIGDYDNDGRVDALVVDSEGRPLLLHNESTAPPDDWIGLKLVGRGKSNRDAYGAQVTLRVGDKRYLRQCQACGSYLSSSDSRVHFGLGGGQPDSITVLWPDGTAETWTNPQKGRYVTLEEGEDNR
ncbi:MAG TPA: CRTAC1 family protein, partial [Chthonomonadales bacterium]|nr:CRTAC1 family protein [Chthonomonadales bacterium]